MEDVLGELRRTEALLKECYNDMAAEMFLVEATENLKKAEQKLTEAGRVLHDQIRRLEQLKQDL